MTRSLRLTGGAVLRPGAWRVFLDPPRRSPDARSQRRAHRRGTAGRGRSFPAPSRPPRCRPWPVRLWPRTRWLRPPAEPTSPACRPLRRLRPSEDQPLHPPRPLEPHRYGGQLERSDLRRSAASSFRALRRWISTAPQPPAARTRTCPRSTPGIIATARSISTRPAAPWPPPARFLVLAERRPRQVRRASVAGADCGPLGEGQVGVESEADFSRRLHPSRGGRVGGVGGAGSTSYHRRFMQHGTRDFLRPAFHPALPITRQRTKHDPPCLLPARGRGKGPASRRALDRTPPEDVCAPRPGRGYRSSRERHLLLLASLHYGPVQCARRGRVPSSAIRRRWRCSSGSRRSPEPGQSSPRPQAQRARLALRQEERCSPRKASMSGARSVAARPC